MEMALADLLGWEEGATYELEGLYYSVVGEKLYYFKDFESPRIKFYQDTIIDLLELVNEAEKVEPKKYYLKHKFLGSSGYNYLNYFINGNDYIINDRCSGDCFKSEFTDSEIEKIEATGFDLSNFERIEVEEE